jgi:hypothetical protein
MIVHAKLMVEIKINFNIFSNFSMGINFGYLDLAMELKLIKMRWIKLIQLNVTLRQYLQMGKFRRFLIRIFFYLKYFLTIKKIFFFFFRWVVFRFVVDNPGVFGIHCHMICYRSVSLFTDLLIFASNFFKN